MAVTESGSSVDVRVDSLLTVSNKEVFVVMFCVSYPWIALFARRKLNSCEPNKLTITGDSVNSAANLPCKTRLSTELGTSINDGLCKIIDFVCGVRSPTQNKIFGQIPFGTF